MANFGVVRFRFWLLLALAALFSSFPAYADDASRFKDLVKEATDAFGRGDFQRAIDLCNEAFAIKPNPRLLYNRARAEEALGNARQAIADYELYLEREPQTEDRGIIEGRIKALRAQLAESERLAGERAQSAGKKTEARAHYRRYLELAPNARDKKEIEHRLWELDHPAPKKQARARENPAGGAGAGPWVTMAVGGAVLSGGALFGFVSRQKYDDAKNASSGENAAASRDDGDRFTTFANVGLAVGGVAILAGLTWLILSPSPQKSTAMVSW